jgi:hypothetical protein
MIETLYPKYPLNDGNMDDYTHETTYLPISEMVAVHSLVALPPHWSQCPADVPMHADEED